MNGFGQGLLTSDAGLNTPDEGRGELIRSIRYEVSRVWRTIRRRGVRTLPNYCRVRVLESTAARINARTGPETRNCPCCGWQGKRFLPVFLGARYRDHAACPACGSRERHRAYARYYREVEGLHRFEGRVLYVAPAKPVVESVFGKHPACDLVTSDLRPEGVTIQADLTCFPAPNRSYDRILCHHVLEHISKDLQAISEIARLLADNGVAYIAVPQNFDRKVTEEWGRPDPRVSHHVREYGRDFMDRLHCFNVVPVDLSELWGEEDRIRFGLGRRELIYRCTKHPE